MKKELQKELNKLIKTSEVYVEFYKNKIEEQKDLIKKYEDHIKGHQGLIVSYKSQLKGGGK